MIIPVSIGPSAVRIPSLGLKATVSFPPGVPPLVFTKKSTRNIYSSSRINLMNIFPQDRSVPFQVNKYQRGKRDSWLKASELKLVMILLFSFAMVWETSYCAVIVREMLIRHRMLFMDLSELCHRSSCGGLVLIRTDDVIGVIYQVVRVALVFIRSYSIRSCNSNSSH